MKNLLGYLTCVAVAILLRVYINGSGGTLVLYLLAIAFVISLAALLLTKHKLVAAIKLSTEISANGTNFDVSTFVSYFSRIALFTGVAFVLVVFVFLNRIIEVFFRLSLKFRDNGDKVIRLYRRVIRLLTIASNDKLSGYTPEMIREYLVKRRGVELGGLIDLFEKTCFGGYVPDEAEWKMVYAEYKAQWKKLTKREKTTLELDKNM